MDEKLLTPDDLAKRWDIHRATVLRLFHAGILPGVVLNQGKQRTTVRFRPQAVETWEQQRERKRPGAGEV